MVMHQPKRSLQVTVSVVGMANSLSAFRHAELCVFGGRHCGLLR